MTKKRKFGKKNVIKVDPLAYNIGLIAPSGFGKTTMAVEVCEKLVGEDGYLLINCGKEDGIDAIPNAIYEDAPDWETFEEIADDIIENKDTDYKDLKVIIYDTLDELFRIAEPQVIKLNNRENPDKKVKSIKAAYGGFMAGEDKAIEIILDKVWALKNVGVQMFILGHTKTRTQTDPMTGTEYDILTNNMSNRYFNAIKTKLHILGVGSFDRSIEKTTVKKMMNVETKGKIVDERRLITFRDNNYNIDSKSRFADIIEQIPLDADEFIEAINNAIKLAHDKQSGAKSIEETKVEQDKELEEKVTEAVKEANENTINEEENEGLVKQILEKLNSSPKDVKQKAIEYAKDNGISLKEHTETPTYQYKQLLSQFD
ncbi:AAA family ATPase [Sporosarcina sp. FSL W7-1283]|uniref:AAA family ATPase n=1 Tax=Sporosarcina sp. FSL W7-1283 TaxID=2921560 RepID=UPI0030FBE65D